MIWTDPQKTAARQSAALWAGTRHANRIAVPGQGIDCLRFVFEVIIAAGILPRFTLPAYDERLGILRETNVMEGLMRDYCFAERASTPDFGDVAVFSCGPQSNHCGIVIDGNVWHVPGRGRVGPEAWSNVAPQLQSLMRFTAPGFQKPIEGLTWEKIRKSL